MQPCQIAAPHPPTVIAKVHPQTSASVLSQPAYFIVVDDQQSGPSRQLILALSPTKTYNLPSVTSRQQEDSQHKTSGLSSVFGTIQSLLQYQEIDIPRPFSPSPFQTALSPALNTTQQDPARPPSQFSQQIQPKSAD